MIVIGLMSGTSVDGIDAAVVDIHGVPPNLSVGLRAFVAVPYTAQQRARIFALFDPATGTVDQICQMNFVLGEWFARAAQQAMDAAGLTPDDVDLIGSHGQTIYHRVEAAPKSTLQIGEAAVIAEQTGVTTISDFRTADVAAGGQGAPMVSYLDWLLLRPSFGRHKVRVAQNIGGIANLTYLPPGDDPNQAFAFDTGPGNMVIDALVQRHTNGRQSFDTDGKLAAQGKINQALLAELMKHPYLAQPVPKTTGREQFGAPYVVEIWRKGQAKGINDLDMIATVTAFTAASIANAYHCFLPQMPDEVIVGGGGAHNPILMTMLQSRLPDVHFIAPDAFGFSSDAKEAVAFALLAYETLHGRPGNLPACTGATRRKILGKIAPGENFKTIMGLRDSAGLTTA